MEFELPGVNVGIEFSEDRRDITLSIENDDFILTIDYFKL